MALSSKTRFWMKRTFGLVLSTCKVGAWFVGKELCAGRPYRIHGIGMFRSRGGFQVAIRLVKDQELDLRISCDMSHGTRQIETTFQLWHPTLVWPQAVNVRGDCDDRVQTCGLVQKSAPYSNPGMNILLDTLQRIVILRRVGTNVAVFLALPLHASCMFGRVEHRQ
jgi:hypothetical protein